MDGLRPMSGISLPSPSPRATRFSETYDIAPRRPKNKIPTSLNTWVVGGTVVLMLALAGAIEVALHFSNNNHGFPMGRLDTDKVQWLSGFIPTLAIGPLVWIWKQTDKDFKKLQPYVTLSQGPARAEESVLMDLEHDNLFRMLRRALRNGNYLIIGSSLIVLANILLHPLSGAFFLVKPGVMTRPSDNPVRSTAILGLNPSYKDLTTFVSAAGYAEAAAMYNLSDPPFVKGGWAVAPFEFTRDITHNTTISVNTTGVLTNVSCSALDVSMTQNNAVPSNWTLTVNLLGRPGCTANQTVNGSVSETQYGVDIVPGCSTSQVARLASRFDNNDPFQQPLLWFASIPRSLTVPQNVSISGRAADTPVGRAVFCAQAITVHSVGATADGTTGLLVNVDVTGNLNQKSNNVTGDGLAGNAFNGLNFDGDADFSLGNPFVEARALSVQSGIPGAILRAAQGNAGSPIFENATDFALLTERIYTQYLSLVALSNYFISADAAPLSADVTIWPNRLWISPMSAHFLAGLLVLVATSGTLIHILHRRQRKRLYLASRPGSMAHYMSLLSHPQIASPTSRDDINGKLGPLDDEKTMLNKLAGVRFTFNEQSGTIVPVIAGEPWAAQGRGRMSWRGDRGSHSEYELEDPRRALLGSGSNVEGS